MRCVLGVDGGATHTTCVAIDSVGEILCRGEADSSDHQDSGIESSLMPLKSAVARAVETVDRLEVEAICVGLAEIDRPEEVLIASQLMYGLVSKGLSGNIHFLPGSSIVVCDDSLIALVGGTGTATGTVVIAGTGSIAFGRNRNGQTKRVGGWGNVFGDEGSAYDIAVRGLQAAVRSHDGRLGGTILKQRLAEHFGVRNVEDLMDLICRRRWEVREIAKLAPVVDQSAAEGDLVSLRIIGAAVEELSLATRIIGDSIFADWGSFEVVTVGSVWQGRSHIRERFEKAIVELVPSARVISPRHEPAWGAALLALSALGKFDLGIDFGDPGLPLIHLASLQRTEGPSSLERGK
jgi:N-acetylglucosamine kinase-like BadF-type ATPase